MNSMNFNRAFFLLLFLLGFFYGAKSQQLSKKITTITVAYSAISCECAQWNVESKKNSTDSNLNIYVEPANSKLINANSLWDGEHLPLRLKLTGQYYLKDGFPKNYKPIKGDPKPAKVFRYTAIVVVSK